LKLIFVANKAFKHSYIY